MTQRFELIFIGKLTKHYPVKRNRHWQAAHHDFLDNPLEVARSMKRSAATPADYLAQTPDHQSALLQSLRAAIFKVCPDIDEGIRYGMLDYPGLANLAAQKNYVALYVMPSVLEAFKSRFPGVSCGKSCLRFARLEQFDEGVVHELLQAVHNARSSTKAPDLP